ncbi:conserved protein of unknown function [Ruminococcaceae bacterium BL-6]|nr:conserved protein of unknown function [Ruminococcaceae bacterium BL-6]
MPDYQKLYIKLFQATENAINMLVDAQRECEEFYLSPSNTEMKVLPTYQKPDSEAPNRPENHVPAKPSK